MEGMFGWVGGGGATLVSVNREKERAVKTDLKENQTEKRKPNGKKVKQTENRKTNGKKENKRKKTSISP